MFQQRSVGTDAKERCGLVVRCACGFRVVCFCAMPSAVRFVLYISGGKLSFSGRTGLDLGRVCGVRKGLDPDVCCVVL